MCLVTVPNHCIQLCIQNVSFKKQIAYSVLHSLCTGCLLEVSIQKLCQFRNNGRDFSPCPSVTGTLPNDSLQSYVVENVLLLNAANVTAPTIEGTEKALHELFLQQAGYFSPIFNNE